jgi:DNA-binding Lrp family transcriptional regulator
MAELSALGMMVNNDVRTESLVNPEILLDQLDKTDFKILRKFYLSGPKPYDTSMYVQVLMQQDLAQDGLKLTVRAVGLRLGKLVKMGLIKEGGLSPKIYSQKEELKVFIRKLIGMYSSSLGIELI